MILEPGMEVECIDDGGFSLIKTGEKYIVDYVFYSEFTKGDMVCLVGVERDPRKTAMLLLMMVMAGLVPDAPTSFDTWRFRPLKKTQTDISALQEILKTKEEELT